MVLSDLGKVVAEEWEETARRRPFVTLDAWIVMPNHFRKRTVNRILRVWR